MDRPGPAFAQCREHICGLSIVSSPPHREGGLPPPEQQIRAYGLIEASIFHLMLKGRRCIPTKLCQLFTLTNFPAFALMIEEVTYLWTSFVDNICVEDVMSVYETCASPFCGRRLCGAGPQNPHTSSILQCASSDMCLG
jgi:hypothetical protein